MIDRACEVAYHLPVVEYICLWGSVRFRVTLSMDRTKVVREDGDVSRFQLLSRYRPGMNIVGRMGHGDYEDGF